MPANLLVSVLTYIGLIAAAISGMIEARQKDLDAVGAITVAFLTALGGGTLRDIVLGRFPVFWIQEEAYALTAFGVSLLAFYASRLLRLSERAILIPDAIGLGMFTIIGVDAALEVGSPLFASALMGVVTGIFGGILRDVVCREIPVVFARNAQLYATCSFAGAWVYLLLLKGGMLRPVAASLGFVVVLGMRILAVRLNLRLPDPV